nr:hypothetical protein [Tanacetum cinerariifolium]
MTTPTVTSSTDSQMHNNIMVAGSRDRPPTLAIGRYPQWRSRFLRYIDTRLNGDALRKCILSGPYKPTTVLVQAVAATDDSLGISKHTTVETPMNMSPENKAHFQEEKEAIHLILTGIGDEIYSTIDACQTPQEIWEAIERLQQGESLNIQDVKTNLFWEFARMVKISQECQPTVGNKMHKTFPLPIIEFPLAEEVPTASEESYRCQKKREATAKRIALLVIEFGDSYEVPASAETTETTSGGTGMKTGRTVIMTTEDMQKRKNDVKARTTLLISLPDEHQLRFSKYKTAQELWAAILKIFGGNEATKKTKKNLLKQQYGNFKAEGSETLEQTFKRLQVIVGQLQFIDIEIEQDDLNQKFLTNLAPECLMHTIVWRNKSDLDTMSLDDLYNHLRVYESEVQKKLEPNSQNMAFISSAKHSRGNEDVNTASVSTASTNVPTASANNRVASISQDTACAYIASQYSGSQIKFEDINQIDKDEMEEMDIKWSMALLSMRDDKECRAPRSQDRGRRDNYRQGSKVEEQAPKALMAIDGVGWDWSYMANGEEDHALVADEEAPIEFALMANTSPESKVFDNSLCSKDSQVESKLVEHKEREIKYCKKIRGLELVVKFNTNKFECIAKELETLKKEKEGVEDKLAGFLTASKDLDNLIKSQRSDLNKEGLGYSDVPPPAQIYSSLKKDLSWTGLLEFADDTVTDYSRPSPTMESTSGDDQNRNPSVSETDASPSTITPKPFIKFVKPNDSPSKSKTGKTETPKKPPVKYAEQYKKPNKKPYVRGNQRNWNNLKSHQLGPNFVMKKKACFNCGDFNHLAYDCRKRIKKGHLDLKGSSQNNINDKGYWDSGCSRHMTRNISYLSDYEPFDRGYVSFGQG